MVAGLGMRMMLIRTLIIIIFMITFLFWTSLFVPLCVQVPRELAESGLPQPEVSGQI